MAMRRNFNSVVRPFAAAALAATLPMSLVATYVHADDQPGASTPLTGAAALDAAKKLLDDGHPVAARSLIVRTFKDDGTVYLGDQKQITPSDLRSRAMVLLAEANRKIGMLSPMEASLQKAEVALDEGD